MIRPTLEAHDSVGFIKLILQVCAVLRGQGTDIADENKLPQSEVEMMLLTAAAESSLIFRCQLHGGPARGLCQMEPATALDTFRWLGCKNVLWERFTDIWLSLKTVHWFAPTEDEVTWHLTHNDAFALALARLHYRMFPEPFPRAFAKVDQASYWKKYWNTEKGKGTVEHALRQWDSCGCDRLMSIARNLVTLE